MNDSSLFRLFVGGLPQAISETEIIQRFDKFGAVKSCDVKLKTDPTGEWMKTFAYLNMEMTQADFSKCKGQLNNSNWKGGKLSIQLAKQDKSVKYAEERTESTKAELSAQCGNANKSLVIPTELKGAVPGTVLPEHKNWVVTKFQRVVPVMHIRSRDKKKLIKYDPSKHCRQIKSLQSDKTSAQEVDSTRISQLTWNLDDSRDTDSVTYKRKVGDFTGLSSMAQRKRGRSANEVIQAEKAKRMKWMEEDDMEIVPTANSIISSNNPAINSSMKCTTKFDSDSESETDMSMTKITTSAPTSKELNRFCRSGSDSSENKPAAKRQKIFSKKSSDIKRNGCIANGQSFKVITNKNGTNIKQITMSSSSDSTSSESDSEPEITSKRKPFPGTAAITISKHSRDSTESSLDSGMEDDNESSRTRLQSVAGEIISTDRTRADSCDTESSDTQDGDSSNSSSDTGKVAPVCAVKSTKEIVANSVSHSTTSCKKSVHQSSSASSDMESHDSDDSSNRCADGEAVTAKERLSTALQALRKAVETGADAADVAKAAAAVVSATTATKSSTPTSQSTSQSTSSTPSTGYPGAAGDGPSVLNTDTRSLHSTTFGTGQSQSNFQMVCPHCSSDSGDSSDTGSNDTESSDTDSNNTDSSDTDSSDTDSLEDIPPTASNSITHNQQPTQSHTAKPSNSNTSGQGSVGRAIEEVCENKSGKLEKKKEKSYLTTAEKKKVADLKRIEALKCRDEEAKSRQKIIQDSLKNLDAPSNKRVVFDSDDETGNGSSTAMQQKASSGPKILFESDESVDEEEEAVEDGGYDKMFSIKPQFEGEKGAKLLKLQHSYKEDSRFRLTEHFMDSESDAETKNPRAAVSDESAANKQVAGGGGNEDFDAENERRRNLEILQSVVGFKKVKIDAPTTSQKWKKVADTPSTVFRSLATVQYDPSLEESEKLVKPAKTSSEPKPAKFKKKKLEGVEPVVNSEPAPQVSAEKFYDVTIDFKSASSQPDGDKPLFGFLDKEEETISRPDDSATFNFQLDDAAELNQLETSQSSEHESDESDSDSNSDNDNDSDSDSNSDNDNDSDSDSNSDNDSDGDDRSDDDSGGASVDDKTHLEKKPQLTDMTAAQKLTSSSSDECSSEDVESDSDSVDNSRSRVDNSVQRTTNGAPVIKEEKRTQSSTSDSDSESSEEEGGSDLELPERKLIEMETEEREVVKPDKSLDVGKTTCLPNTVVDWFFFKADDPRLIDGSLRFSRTMSDDKLKTQWNEIRPKLVEDYLQKSKRATKKAKTTKKSIAQKRFGKPSKNKPPRCKPTTQ